MHKPAHSVFMNDDEISDALDVMEQDASLKTVPDLVKDEVSAHTVSFKQKHATYLKEHPKVNPEHYLANLHAMIKIR